MKIQFSIERSTPSEKAAKKAAKLKKQSLRIAGWQDKVNAVLSSKRAKLTKKRAELREKQDIPDEPRG